MRLQSYEIQALVAQFCDRTLPKNKWNHEGHLIVGIWHHFQFSFDNAVDLLRKRIIDYNESVGTTNSDDSGYHETLTIFWMITIKNFILLHPHLSLVEVCNLFIKSETALKTYPLQFYSKEKLLSKEARRTWIDGDIKPVTNLTEK